MKLNVLVALIILISTNSVFAAPDSWTPVANKITIVQPLLKWNGGVLRIKTNATVAERINPASCQYNSGVYDLDYSVGTQEMRSSITSALYMAYSIGKEIRLYIDGTTCSAAGA